MSKRVIIADGGFGDRMILRDYLSSFGCHVAGEAKCGEEAVKKFHDLKPDLLVLDAGLRDMDGVEVVRHIMLDDREATILICVANGQRSLAVEALSAGAKEFITKPIDARKLKRMLHRLGM